ncbi:14237_t:CDS:2, partial [Racocetra persica]
AKPKESQLDEDKYIMASTISQIREKYFCANCEGSCWATKTGHVKLTGMHYTTWARAILNRLTDINTLSSHAIFTLLPNKRGIPNSQLSSQLSQQMPWQIPSQVLFQVSSQALSQMPSQIP